ncbi:MAG: hypothetical protein A2X42_12235 [Candidatus Margulisbacteria bacterium GWF2_38_17]|nr:MAG: hypothetical protein A2X42_12235 [Candidatus Margulisbacteria bacterium GWF2_38_17]OGI09557.1 MAG: hypothetical protein A2X41_06440 [Candidatus Margulisbacteria bacterium GWE2_39_32]
MTIDISIIIVNWNVKNLLKDCLVSIENAKHTLVIETIVIDNASSDGSSDMVKQEFPGVILIANTMNKGFAAANNQGIAIAKGIYNFILNPDTELESDTLIKMHSFMQLRSDVGMIGPQLFNTDGSLQPSCRRFPRLRFQLFNKLFLSTLFPRTYLNGYMMGDFDYLKTAEVEQPMGAALFVRKSVVDKIGMMDDHNFVWFDEVDWCYQLKKAGEIILFYPEAKLTHHQGKSFRLWRNPFSGIVWLKSRHYFLKKNYGIVKALTYVFIDFLFYCIYASIIISIIIFFINRFA